MIEVVGVNKKYRLKKGEDVVALKDVSLKIDDKEMTFIVGKSGSGKTTLLNLIGSLDTCDSGEILIDGISMNKFTKNQIYNYRNDYLGFVFQDYNLIDEMTVEENLKVVVDLLGEKYSNSIATALEKVGLSGFEKRKISRR